MMKLNSATNHSGFDVINLKSIAANLGSWRDELRYRQILISISSKLKIKGKVLSDVKRSFKTKAKLYLDMAVSKIEKTIVDQD